MKNPEKNSGLFGFWQNMSGMFSRPRNTFMAYAIALGGLLGGLTGCSKDGDVTKPDPKPGNEKITLSNLGLGSYGSDIPNNLSGDRVGSKESFTWLRDNNSSTKLKYKTNGDLIRRVAEYGSAEGDLYKFELNEVTLIQDDNTEMTVPAGTVLLYGAPKAYGNDTTAAKASFVNSMNNMNTTRFQAGKYTRN